MVTRRSPSSRAARRQLKERYEKDVTNLTKLKEFAEAGKKDSTASNIARDLERKRRYVKNATD